MDVCERSKHAKGHSGVYEIRHTDGRVYIGCSVCCECRWRIHRGFLKRGVHQNPYLQRAWNRYGPDAFHWRIIEVCPREMLLQREQHWIDATGCTNRAKGFNLALTAGTMLGFKHSPQSIERIRQAKRNPSEHTRNLIRLANLGRKHPLEVRLQIAAHSAKRRLSDADVLAIQQRYEAAQGTISQTQLAAEYGVSTTTISAVVRRSKPIYQTDVPQGVFNRRKLCGAASRPPDRRALSAEHKAHIGQGLLGRPVSAETRRKLSERLLAYRATKRKGEERDGQT